MILLTTIRGVAPEGQTWAESVKGRTAEWEKELLEAAQANDRRQEADNTTTGTPAEVNAAYAASHKGVTASPFAATANREREALFRATVGLEKTLASLPKGHGQVAGYLQAKGQKGGTGGYDNALASYLHRWALRDLDPACFEQWRDLVTVYVEAHGIIVETPKYQLVMDPPPWLEMFITRLRAGDFPELVE